MNDSQSGGGSPSQALFRRAPHDRQNPYTMISRELLQNHSLSFHARGFLAYLLSLPPEWKVNLKQIAKASGKNVQTIRSWVNELTENGYCRWCQERDPSGKMGATFYEFSEYPQKIPNSSEENPPHNECEPETKKPCTEKPCTVFSPHNKYIDKKEDTGKIHTAPGGASSVSPVFSSSTAKGLPRSLEVFITDEQHQLLLAKYPPEFVQACYDYLSDWKSSATPAQVRKHKSDYRRITCWVINAVRDKQLKEKELDQREARANGTNQSISRRRNSKLWLPQDEQADDYDWNSKCPIPELCK